MRKIILVAMSILMVLSLVACGSKNSEPDEKRITGDIVGQVFFENITVKTVDKLTITDTKNTKSTDGYLKYEGDFTYTDSEGTTKDSPFSIFYIWDDNTGWKFQDFYFSK